jgi:hypothetical protein
MGHSDPTGQVIRRPKRQKNPRGQSPLPVGLEDDEGQKDVPKHGCGVENKLKTVLFSDVPG